DVVCAMPAMRAVKQNFSGSRVTLLTSPGARGGVGAKDFLDGAPYLDEIIAYYSDDISTPKKIMELASRLRREKYDLFIQLPDDWARFKTLARNEVFAKLIGAKSAFGFRARTSNLFKKIQVDFTFKDKESVALLKILAKNGINGTHQEVKFEFPEYSPLSADDNSKIEALKKESEILLGVCMSGKTEDKRWPAEKFGEVLRNLGAKRKIGLIFFGGPGDFDSAESVAKMCKLPYINFAGKPIKESILAIKRGDAFLTADTGPMHIAAAFGIPIVALFNIRSVYGSWFPYGENNICLYKRFLKCDYLKENCVKQSLLAISAEEVAEACEQVFAAHSKIK
ncbi:MAG: glycosyltransferase family 9 protein, partial [Candidatus Liptonbacteria bacterium]|nr:glycosyltransferase family 9 protein [Candidatus Liptonbacteria bacterium]